MRTTFRTLALVLSCLLEPPLAWATGPTKLEITEANATAVAAVLSTGELPVGQLYVLKPEKATHSVRSALTAIPTKSLFRICALNPQACQLATEILVAKNDPEALKAIVDAVRRRDVLMQYVASGLQIWQDVKLPDYLLPVVSDTSVPCSTRQAFIALLKERPSAESATLVRSMLEHPEQLACPSDSWQEYPEELNRAQLFVLLAALDADGAARFFQTLPKCRAVRSYRNAAATPFPNPDRFRAIDVLGAIDRPSSVEALTFFIGDQFTADDCKACPNTNAGTSRMCNPFPWRLAARTALFGPPHGLPSVTIDQLRTANIAAGGELTHELLRRGPRAVSALDDAVDKFPCVALSALLETQLDGDLDSTLGISGVRHDFLRGSKTHSIMLDLLHGLAAPAGTPGSAASSTTRTAGCRQASLASLDMTLPKLFFWAAAVGDDRSIPDLVAFASHAPAVPTGQGAATSSSTAPGYALNPYDPRLVATRRSVDARRAVEALARFGTAPARTAIEDLVLSTNDEGLRSDAQRALAVFPDVERLRKRGDMKRVLVKCDEPPFNSYFSQEIRKRLGARGFDVAGHPDAAGLRVECMTDRGGAAKKQTKPSYEFRLVKVADKDVVVGAVKTTDSDSRTVEQVLAKIIEIADGIPAPLPADSGAERGGIPKRSSSPRRHR